MNGARPEPSASDKSVFTAGTNQDQTNSDGMVAHHRPTSNAECVALLHSVLECLDEVPAGRSQDEDNALSLAAAHVQQAIELIQSAGETKG